MSDEWLPDPIRVEANGLTFNVLDAGAGPCVLLLHGFPDSHRLWRNQVPALLEAGFRVVAPDLRGLGESDRPDGIDSYAVGNVIDDLRGILRVLGLPRVHVVGHDWGSAVAWMLATVEPTRVDRLVAVSVGHPAAFAAAGIAQSRLSWYTLLFQFPGLGEELFPRDDWRFLEEWTGGGGDLAQYKVDLARPGALGAALNWYRANMPPGRLLEPAPQFPKITSPVMGVWGALDQFLGEPQMTGSEAFVEGSWRYQRIEDAAHWVPLECPAELNALLLEFLSAGPRGLDPNADSVRRAFSDRGSKGLGRRLSPGNDPR